MLDLSIWCTPDLLPVNEVCGPGCHPAVPCHQCIEIDGHPETGVCSIEAKKARSQQIDLSNGSYKP